MVDEMYLLEFAVVILGLNYYKGCRFFIPDQQDHNSQISLTQVLVTSH